MLLKFNFLPVRKIFLTVFFLFTLSIMSFSQDRKDKNPVTYEELYDEPYAINKLFIQFQPLYGELFVTNVTAGFGLEATYFWDDKAQFRAHARKAYASQFDFAREAGRQTSDVKNVPEVFNYYELGGTYHIKDFEESSKTKMVLYKKSYKGDRWASRVPLIAEIPSKVRKIYGGRLGGFAFDSHTDVNRALTAQDKTLADLVDEAGNSIPAEVQEGDRINETHVFTNIDVKGLYLGASMSWIRNVAVDFDKYEAGVDDLIMTAFFDILIAPAITLEDIIYSEIDPATGELVTRRFSSDVLDTNLLGFRLGLDGKFNRTLSWGYGGEFGYRPSLKGRGFYAMLKISFPVYSTNLDYGVEAFGK